MPTISDRFATTCSVGFHNNYDTCGTVTRSTIANLTPSDLDTLFFKGGLFADLDAWFTTQIELKACGVPTNGLYDWIMSGADRTIGKSLLNTVKSQGSPSLLQPFIKAKQDSVINTDCWTVVNGAAYNAAYSDTQPGTVVGLMTAGPLTAADIALGTSGDRIVRVISSYGVVMTSKWFQERQVLHIFNRVSGVAKDGAWKVIAAESSTDGGYTDVLLHSQNAGSSNAADLTPTTGILLEGVNNVNDYERWCNNKPNYDGRKIVPFWFQTMRRTRCVDSEYMKVFARLIQSNRAFAEFGDMSITQRNAQDEMNYQKNLVNAIFFNKPISANQTLALWESLEAINTFTSTKLDPGTGGAIVGRRANFIGIEEQLYRCGRYIDLGNQPLNLYELLIELFNIQRAREAQGRTVTDIDIYTDPVSRADFMTAYIAYTVKEYGSSFRLNYEVPKKGSNPQLGFVWDTYQFKHPAGININVVSHNAFADFRQQMAAINQESAGCRFLILDMGAPGPKGGTIFWSQITSNRVVHSVGDLDKLGNLTDDWGCVMTNITKEVKLTSETGTVIVSCPNNSLWITNSAPVPPIVTGPSSPYTDLK